LAAYAQLAQGFRIVVDHLHTTLPASGPADGSRHEAGFTIRPIDVPRAWPVFRLIRAMRLETLLVLNNNRVYAMFRTQHPDIPQMTDFMAWYEQGNMQSLRDSAAYNAEKMCRELPLVQPGRRVMQCRLIMQYETEGGAPYYADPLPVFENGGYFISKAIRMLRPTADALRAQGLFVDAIFLDIEGGFTFWGLKPEQIQAIFASPKARAYMPPNIASMKPENITWWVDGFDPVKATRWNKWAQAMLTRALRRIFIESNFFNLPRKPGGPPMQPAVFNFNYISPTWPLKEYNGWPVSSQPLIDYRSSCVGFYFTPGGRYNNRTHHYLWNILIDALNYVRSCLSRPDARFWPTILQPGRVNPWLMEQMVAHFARTGLNWSGSRSAYIYFNQFDYLATNADPILVDIMKRHDDPFPRQYLQEIPLDSDRIETMGFVTTYEDFLAQLGLTGNETPTASLPISVQPTRMAA
jgi:hypothetical protein